MAALARCLPLVLASIATAIISRGTAAEPAAPLPYVAAPALAGITVEQPLAIVTPPGETNRAFVIEKSGRILDVPDLTRPTHEVFLDISDRLGTNRDGELGRLALALHPQYRTNRQFYVWYSQRIT